jgi:hypothetical protein
MLHYSIKIILSAVLILAISELSKRNSLFGALVASLPLISILGMVWLYQDTRDATKVSDLATSIFWLVIPSLILFLVFPILVKRGLSFYPALGGSIFCMLGGYGIMLVVLSRIGIKL